MNINITSLLLLLGCMQLSATTLSQTINLKAEAQPLTKVFATIEKQTGYFVVYNSLLQQSADLITIEATNMPLDEFLNTILEARSLKYTIYEKTILITPASTVSQASVTKQKRQQRQLTGRVTDKHGEPLEGVNVTVKGTSTTASTDPTGRYRLLLTEEAETLVFSIVGYVRHEASIPTNNNLDVTLEEAVSNLDEVIVVGYGAMAKKDLTGAVGTVNMADLAKAPVMSFDQALAGRLAGVQVSSGEGQPGTGAAIVIRGANSLTQSNAPLMVIDGFPIEGSDNLAWNPDDIESITVLKDASATAIYGARGSNGVIVIETKKGKVGRPQITYNGSTGWSDITNRVEVMDPYEFVRYQQERSPSNAAQRYLDSLGRTLEDYKSIRGYNWQDELFQQAPMHLHNLAMRGGTEQTRYSLSGSIGMQDGVILNSGHNRYQGRMSLDQVVTDKLSVGANLNYSNRIRRGQLASAGGTDGSASSKLLYSVWGYRPVGGTVDLLDDLLDPDVDPSSDYRINPIISVQNELTTRRDINLIANAYATYKFTEDLSLKVTGGLNSITRRDDEFYNSETRRGTPQIPSNTRGVQGSVNFRQTYDWVNENTLTWKKTLNADHTFHTTAGFTVQGRFNDRYGLAASQIPNEELWLSGLDEGVPYQQWASESEFTLASFLGRVNYSYQSKYLLTASLRADGSSKFSRGNRWSYFPSAAFAWRMSEENFMNHIDFITDAKLRVSYGVTGNNRIGDFAYRGSLTFPLNASYSWSNQYPTKGAIPGNLGNTNLRWESTEQLDIGYDISLFNERLSLEFDVYRKNTFDLLLNANMPYTTGFSTAIKNVGKTRNEGLEITLNTVNIQTEAFSWQSNFNISFNRNRIMALNDDEEFISSTMSWDTQYNNTPLYIAEVGQPAAMFFGYIFDGVYQYEDFNEIAPGQYVLKGNIPTNGNPRANIRPGDIKYRDINGDGEVNSLDQTIIGRGLPKHIGGFNNNFSYRGFDLNIFFQWSYGNDLFNANRIIFEGSARGSLNQFASFADRWTPENPSNTLYRAGGQGPGGVYSSRVIEDGSYLRLKTLSLSYTIPSRYLQRTGISNLSVNARAQNLFTWTNYSGMDPEVAVRSTVLTPGFDYSAYPHAKIYTFGINLSL